MRAARASRRPTRSTACRRARPTRVASVDATARDAATVTGRRVGQTTVTVRYQREPAAGGNADVFNLDGGDRRPVAAIVTVTVRP